MDILPWPPGSSPASFPRLSNPGLGTLAFLFYGPRLSALVHFWLIALHIIVMKHSIPNLSATLNVKDFVEVDVNGDGACSYGFVVFIDSKSITIWIGYTPTVMEKFVIVEISDYFAILAIIISP